MTALPNRSRTVTVTGATASTVNSELSPVSVTWLAAPCPTVTVVFDVVLIPSAVAFKVYVVVTVGLTATDVLPVTSPIP